MVPLNWAFFNADVNAGTASAARIAIIAITTSNSIRVNAEEGLFILIFIFGFSISVGFRLRTRLRRTSVLRVSQRVRSGVLVGLLLGFVQSNPAPKLGAYRSLSGLSQ